MKYIIYTLLALGFFEGFTRIAKVNRYKKEGKSAFLTEKYDVAVARFAYLADTLEVQDEDILINLANALYRSDSIAKADQRYKQIIASGQNDNFVSLAYNQAGIILANSQKYQEAINYFKDALRSDPDNEEARYNYELLMKMMQKNQQQQNQQQDQPEPSDFAKRLKKAAEQLAQEGRFNEAYNLMQQGLKTDVTVGVYQTFINKLGDVATIDEKY
jgi:tetratricopeptide (TPR) repeat protein